MKPTLFVLAAGMGSRYGGLKQLDGVGPNGETIMDYTIFDAGSAKWSLSYGKILKPTSGRKSCPNTRIISRWKSFSSRPTNCRKVSLALLNARSRGARITRS